MLSTERAGDIIYILCLPQSKIVGFVSQRVLMFPKMKLRVTLTIKGEQTDFFLRSQALIIQLLTEKGTKQNLNYTTLFF